MVKIIEALDDNLFNGADEATVWVNIVRWDGKLKVDGSFRSKLDADTKATVGRVGCHAVTVRAAFDKE